jgi:hypothetical protein
MYVINVSGVCTWLAWLACVCGECFCTWLAWLACMYVVRLVSVCGERVHAYMLDAWLACV